MFSEKFKVNQQLEKVVIDVPIKKQEVFNIVILTWGRAVKSDGLLTEVFVCQAEKSPVVLVGF